MKHTIALFVALLLVLCACKDKYIARYKMYEPVYMDLESFRSSVAFESPRPVKVRGNIYIKDEFLFIVETNAGVHFINNSDPSNPIQTGFLKIPGCSNIAIRGSVMYASSLMDVVCIDLGNISQPKEFKRLENVFPGAEAVCLKNYPKIAVESSKGLVVDWKIREMKEETDQIQYSGNNGGIMTFEGDVFLSATSGNPGTGSSGISGSITKFALAGDYLYVYDQGKLTPIDISNPQFPVQAAQVWMQGNVETLFPHGDYLFMGTTTGMLVYGLSNPAAPAYVSGVAHMRACDPVVVEGNYAYVTVRSNSFCGGNINQLQVIDITNIQQPELKKTFEMRSPHGLGIDQGTLFICDGDDGLKVYDASQPENCGSQLIEKYRHIKAIDVIPHNQLAIVIGENGIYQYDYSNRKNISLLSKIEIEN
ncbi:MAG: LVIVD repeat-containing protein [Bacteroidota bacterium]